MRKRVVQCCFLSLAVLVLLFGSGITIVQAQQPTDAEAFTTTGSIYYIDDVNGSDSNLGNSTSQAWKSLAKVNTTTFAPGDQILFRSGGKWSGTLHPLGSGTLGNMIRIGQYGTGNRPLIEGKGLVENVVYLYNQQYWEISQLEITNKGTTAATSPRRGVLVSGEDFEKGNTTNITNTKVLKGIYIHDLYVHDVNGQDKKDADGSSGIQVSVKIAGLDANGIPTGNAVHQRTTFDDVRIINNEIRNVARSGIITWNDWKNRPLLGDNLGYGVSALTPWTPITNVVIRGNKLYDIGGDGIVPHMSDGALVEYNLVNGYNRTSAGYNVAMWTWDGDNTMYQYNEVTRGYSTRDGMPFDFDHGTQGVIYQYNYSYNNDGGTLLLCADGRGGEVKDGIFRYNISQNDKYQTFSICSGSNVKNIQIYNNIFYVGAGMNTNLLVSQGAGVEANLYNNIFINNGSGGYTAKSTWKYNHNSFSGNKVPTKTQIPDPYMITTAPKLANPGSAGPVLDTAGPIVPDQITWSGLAGYKLQGDSPLINAGRFISVTHNPGSHDFWGNPIYNGLPDVGVHEYEGQAYPYVPPFEPSPPRTQAVIVNGDFENTAGHANGNPWLWQWNAGIVNDGNAYGGNYAGYIKAVSGGASVEQQFAVEPGTAYRLSAYTKIGDAAQKVFFGVKWDDSVTGHVEKSIPVTSSNYTLNTLEFTTGNHTTGITMYYYKESGPAKKSYIDDVKIVEAGVIDKVPLTNVLVEAQQVFNDTLVGTAVGQVSVDAKTQFGAAITSAQSIVQNEAALQTEIDAAVVTLQHAVSTFRAAIVQPEINFVKNGDFEDSSQHANTLPWQWQWNAGIVNDGNAHSGNFAGYIKEVSGGASIEQQIIVEPNTTYQLSAYTKVPNSSQVVYFGLKWNDNVTGAGQQMIPVSGTDYAFNTLNFTTGSNTPSVTIYFYKESGAAAKSYIDDVVLKKIAS